MNKTERIIEAARNRFFYYGIAKTTMQEIAQDAGVAVGTLYLYFKNKDDLVVACAGEFVEQHRCEIAEVLAENLPADEKIRKYVVSRFRAAAEIRTGTRHAVELTRTVLRLKPDRAQEEGMMIWDTVSRILKQGVEQQTFRIASIEGDAKVFMFSIAYFFPSALYEPPPAPAEDDLLTVVDWFLDTWRTKRNKSRRARARAVRTKG